MPLGPAGSRRNSISVSQTSRGSPPGRRGALDALASQLALSLVDALMLGVVIGGSATMIVTSSNLVAAGAARQRGSRLGFCTCLSYGLPSVGLQLLVAWLGCWHAGR